MDLITKKDIAKYGLIGILVFLITLFIVILLNTAIATAVIWAFNTISPWTIQYTLKNMLAGGVLLTALNLVLHQYRGD